MNRLAVVMVMLLASGVEAQTAADINLLTRPVASGTAIPVQVNLFVSDVISISNVDQSFNADVYVIIRWQDPRLAKGVVQRLSLNEVWHPTLVIINERSIRDHLPEVVNVSPEGEVTYVQRLIGELSARMDLRVFPHDEQSLAIHIAALGATPEDLELTPWGESTDGFNEFSVTGWHLHLGAARIDPLVLPSTGERLPRIVFEVDARRDVNYYRWTMYVPLVLIVLMAWMVFWIDPSLIPSQIALSTASVFTLIAFRFSIRLSLPAVAYMTRMDQFLLGCTVLVFLALGHAVATGRLVKQGREPLARSMDRWGRWIYLTVFAVLVALFL